MNKTIFNLNYKTSIIIVSILGIILGFISNAFYVDGIVDFILYIFRFALFVGIYLIIYFLEKFKDFKLSNARMMGYLMINCTFNIVFALFSITHILPSLFLTLSGIVCFWTIFSFVIEILAVCIKNKFIDKIFNFNKKIGLLISSPIVKLVDSKITND